MSVEWVSGTATLADLFPGTPPWTLAGGQRWTIAATQKQETSWEQVQCSLFAPLVCFARSAPIPSKAAAADASRIASLACVLAGDLVEGEHRDEDRNGEPDALQGRDRADRRPIESVREPRRPEPDERPGEEDRRRAARRRRGRARCRGRSGWSARRRDRRGRSGRRRSRARRQGGRGTHSRGAAVLPSGRAATRPRGRARPSRASCAGEVLAVGARDVVEPVAERLAGRAAGVEGDGGGQEAEHHAGERRMHAGLEDGDPEGCGKRRRRRPGSAHRSAARQDEPGEGAAATGSQPSAMPSE